MKIYFTCSTADFFKHKEKYYAIRDFLVDEKHILTRDWLDHTEKRIEEGDDKVSDIKEIYKGCMHAINDADLVIIEDSVSNFSTGHQITVAIQRQKPTLVLWAVPKHKLFKNMFINGVESDYLETSEYTLENYKEIIKKFINKYKNAKLKNRFHLVLNDVERKYLDWAQYNHGKSRTRIIRDSI